MMQVRVTIRHGFGVHEALEPLLDKSQLGLEFDNMLSAVQPRAREVHGGLLEPGSDYPDDEEVHASLLVAAIELNFPMTSVENDRQFSLMNIVKCESSNRLGEGLLNAPCRIKRSKYTVEYYPYHKAVQA